MVVEHNTQLNVLNYLQVFFKRKWLLVVPLFLGLGAGFFTANTLPKIYESYTVILIREEKLDNPIISGLAVSTSAAQRLNNLREQILGWDRLVKLAQKLNLTQNIKNQIQFENLILNDLRNNIYVNMRGPNIVRIAFRGEKPERTQVIVKTLSDIFIEENITSQTKESDMAITFLEEQIKIYKNKIKASEVAELEDQLRVLLADSTEEHPMVKDLRARITKAKSEIPKGTAIENPEFVKNPVYEKIREELEREIENIKTTDNKPGKGISDGSEKDNQSADVYKIALMSSVLARDITVNQTIYNMLLQRLETAKISKRLETSREGTRYEVLDPARIPLVPIQPNRAMVMAMFAFIGIGIGAGIILLLEVLDTSFKGIDEAKHLLDLPILGAISKIMTQEDLLRQKAKKTTKVVVSVSACVAFILIVVIYSLISRP